jgi:hypothetical protein
MPFEIQEISIQMQVGGNPRSTPGDAGHALPGSSGGQLDIDAIVAKCVRATLQELNEKRNEHDKKVR